MISETLQERETQTALLQPGLLLAPRNAAIDPRTCEFCGLGPKHNMSSASTSRAARRWLSLGWSEHECVFPPTFFAIMNVGTRFDNARA